MDKDGDGLLSVRELQAGLEARGVFMDDRNARVRAAWAAAGGACVWPWTPRQPWGAAKQATPPWDQQGHSPAAAPTPALRAQAMLERADLDRDGGVDYGEFLAATLHLGRLERDERLYKAFRHFDQVTRPILSSDSAAVCS